jgi:hypothetical protein
MKKFIIVTAAILVVIGIGYLVYSKLMIQSNPCASIFEQTTVSLEKKIGILKDKGGAILGRGQIQKLSDQSDQITADLKTCCILFHVIAWPILLRQFKPPNSRNAMIW